MQSIDTLSDQITHGVAVWVLDLVPDFTDVHTKAFRDLELDALISRQGETHPRCRASPPCCRSWPTTSRRSCRVPTLANPR